MVVNPTGRIVAVNPDTEQLTGKKAAGLFGQICGLHILTTMD